MKINTILIVSTLCAAVLFQSCKKINNSLDTKEIGYLTVNLRANSLVEGLETTKGLKVVFENFNEGLRIEKMLEEGVTRIEDLIPGIYSITISGKIAGAESDYILNGAKTNYLIINNEENLEIDVDGATVGPLAFSEVFYAGSTPFYFRNQFYEVTNNSDHIVYLDGLYFANLVPGNATTKLPVWPAQDAKQYVYAERVWKIPGNGTQYPLAPGQSFSMSQFAANHKLPQYNPASPIDCSTSEFEFNMDDPSFPDQPATDMIHVFNDGTAAKGFMPMYLTAVFGGAYVIFQVPEGITYDPVNNAELKTKDFGTTDPTLYAKIPVNYIIDAIECGDNENSITGKRVSSVLDAGMTYVGAIYNSLGVRRKKSGMRPDGTPVLEDTNNSTNDFERKVVPEFRFYKQGIPAWSSAK